MLNATGKPERPPPLHTDAGDARCATVPPSTSTSATLATSPRKYDLTREEEERATKSALLNNTTIPGEIPIKPEIGKFKPLMEPQYPYGTNHAAVLLLQSYAEHGCPVDCGPDWSRNQIITLLLRGPHRSALQRRATQQLRAETTDKINQGYARIVRWGDIKHNIPPKLKLSPVAMIPHKSKEFRCILDLSFELLVDGETILLVNARTQKQANQHAMDYLGSCIKRVVYMIEEH